MATARLSHTHLLLTLLAITSLLHITGAGRSGCKAFGHSCLGGFGKRADAVTLEGQQQQPEVGKLVSLEAALRQYLYGPRVPPPPPPPAQLDEEELEPMQEFAMNRLRRRRRDARGQ